MPRGDVPPEAGRVPAHRRPVPSGPDQGDDADPDQGRRADRGGRGVSVRGHRRDGAGPEDQAGAAGRAGAVRLLQLAQRRDQGHQHGGPDRRPGGR